VEQDFKETMRSKKALEQDHEKLSEDRKKKESK
jgi:hypothetical protein